jgi:RIB43A
MQKEQAKIMSMRNANEDRRRRFLDAPGRTIGIDCQALDAQVAAARRKRDDEKEANRIESELHGATVIVSSSFQYSVH